jgi:hypothetical protein
MPLTAKGKKIKSAMAKSYGKKLGEKVFYSLENKNTPIKGVTTKANSVPPPKKSPSSQRKK